MSHQKPHILTLASWNNYDGEDFGCWDYAEITCPYQPATVLMSCASWEPCGCAPGFVGELDFHDAFIHHEDWPCSASPSGMHRYVEGEPHRPMAVCWTQDWDDSIEQTAFELGLPAGTYLVHPWWDGDAIGFDLVDPLMRTV
jgi:hypothetical protein